MKVLLDTNIIVDVLQKREPWFEAGEKIFLAVAGNLITGCVTAKELADIYYFSRKQFKGFDNVDEKARLVIAKLLSLFEVVDTLGIDCENALAIQNNDYEDAIMIASAVRVGVDCIVTRNTEHYKNSPVMILSPDDFLSFIAKRENL
ncbi:MAG: PIN domain-containing protein [Synergistaceae bacterium]|nr:PIN domain-containing protein [Synergistaceae bacterium]